MSIHRRWLLGLSAILLLAAPGVLAQRLPIKTYTTTDGLAHPTVNRIVRDSRGFLWFCTQDGLSRFDGYAFTNFGREQGLPAGPINDLLETRAGEYWIASDAGLVRFDPRGTPITASSGAEPGAKRPMFTTIVPPDPDRLARKITVLRQGKDGALWVGTRKGLYRLDRTAGESLKYVEIALGTATAESAEIAGVLEDRLGSLWVATPDGLIRLWPDGTSMRYTRELGLPTWYLSGLFEDRDGHLWVTTRGTGLFRFRADATRADPVVTLTVTEIDGLPNPWVRQLSQTSDGRIWAGTARGLAEVLHDGTFAGRRVRSYTERNGLSHGAVTAVGDDLSGNLWLASESAGAMKLTHDGFTSYGRADGLESVHDVFEDRDGHLCFRGHAFGLANKTALEGAEILMASPEEPIKYIRVGCFDGQRFEVFTPSGLTSWGWIMEGITLQTRSGDWWVASAEGLFHYPATDHFVTLKNLAPTAVYTARDGLAEPFRLYEDSRGDIWISMYSSALRGLMRWERATGRLHDLSRAPGLPPFNTDQPRSFIEDRGHRLWIGFNSGLARYSNGTFSFFTASDGLPSGSIVDMHVDQKGRLWMASERNGLIRMDNPDAARPNFVSYTTEYGLSSNNIRVITEDAKGLLYVGGGQGLDRFDPATGRVKHFAASEGLPPGELLSGHRTRDGVLWFGTSNGLARLTPIADRATHFPSILISSLKVAGTSWALSALGEQDIALGDLPPDRNQLQIDFLALGFGSGEVLHYQFKLDGADDDWTVPSDQRTITYASLAPGRYRFQVRAVNSDGVVSEPPARVSFRVLGPIWRRWWFLALTALAVMSAAGGLYRYRVRRLVAMANMRARIATDLHDDIGANLTRIALLTEVATRTGDVGPLESVGRIARESVGSMSDIVWAINPQRESGLDLIRRMRQYADEVLTARGLTMRFEAPQALEHLRLGMDVRRDVLLIFKEAVSNAVRHSGGRAVAITLRIEASRLILAVVDDGAGFDGAADTEGHGLASMRRRARRLNGSLEIVSLAGGGTALTLEIPL